MLLDVHFMTLNLLKLELNISTYSITLLSCFKFMYESNDQGEACLIHANTNISLHTLNTNREDNNTMNLVLNFTPITWAYELNTC